MRRLREGRLSGEIANAHRRTTSADRRTGERTCQQGASRWGSKQPTVPSHSCVLVGSPGLVSPDQPVPGNAHRIYRPFKRSLPR